MALYLDGQKIISDGSGSGGHTIVDSEGTSLEQRTNLQFNGAYSEDNATDDTTEVNVVREMTLAEFDLLSADEKTGFINITDITGGNDDRFQPVIYSTEEREIGVWADGRPLYQKTFLLSTAIYLNQYEWINTGCTIPNADQIISSQFGAGASEISAIADVRPTESYAVYAMNMRNTSVSLSKFTIQYTKSTDTAGSGQWTPQGVPAQHYSENEQVVGTWIDGSTLYEKTFDLTSVSLPNATWTKNVLGTSSSNIKIRKFSGTFNTTGGSYINEPYADYNYCRGTTEFFTAVINDAGNDLDLRPQIDGITMNAGVCTIQYTKSST